MHYFNFDLMIEVLTSWSKLSNINEQIRPHEQIEFRPHDQKFDLLKKLNFDLMKFDLMIIPFLCRWLLDRAVILKCSFLEHYRVSAVLGCRCFEGALIRRSNFFIRSKFTLIFSQFWSGGQIFDHEIKIQKSIIRNFDLMIILAANKSIMRSKFKINYLNLVSCTCG